MIYLKRMHAVLQIRTGFLAASTATLGLFYSLALGLHIDWFVMFLLISASFCVNIVTNIVNGIGGFKKEDNLETINDHYVGKNGLVTGKTKLMDAYLATLLFTGYTCGAGLLIVLLTKDWWFLLVGIFSVLVAIIYSVGPYPLFKLPITEVLSGFFCGFIPTYVAVIFNGGEPSIYIFLLSSISWLLGALLMLVNNICDIKKDTGFRKTLPIIIGERRSKILFIILELVLSVIIFIVFNSFMLFIFALILPILNLCIFYIFFYEQFINNGHDVVGNKGMYIPMYLKYMYTMMIVFYLTFIIISFN